MIISQDNRRIEKTQTQKPEKDQKSNKNGLPLHKNAFWGFFCISWKCYSSLKEHIKFRKSLGWLVCWSCTCILSASIFWILYSTRLWPWPLNDRGQRLAYFTPRHPRLKRPEHVEWKFWPRWRCSIKEATRFILKQHHVWLVRSAGSWCQLLCNLVMAALKREMVVEVVFAQVLTWESSDGEIKNTKYKIWIHIYVHNTKRMTDDEHW